MVRSWQGWSCSPSWELYQGSTGSRPKVRWDFETSAPTASDIPPPKKITSPNASQIILPSGNQIFKCMSLWDHSYSSHHSLLTRKHVNCTFKKFDFVLRARRERNLAWRWVHSTDSTSVWEARIWHFGEYYYWAGSWAGSFLSRIMMKAQSGDVKGKPELSQNRKNPRSSNLWNWPLEL